MLFLISWALASTLGVLDFAVHTHRDDLRPLGAGVADMLMTDLQRGEGVTLVERSRIAAVLGELELQASDAVAPERAARIGELLGADLLVLGAVTVNDTQVRLDARLVEVSTGRSVGAADVEGPIAEFFALERRLALQLLLAAGASVPTKDTRYLQQGPEATLADLVGLSTAPPAYEYVTLRPIGKVGIAGAVLGGALMVGTFSANRLHHDNTRTGWALLQGGNAAGTVLLTGGVTVWAIDRATAMKRR